MNVGDRNSPGKANDEQENVRDATPNARAPDQETRLVADEVKLIKAAQELVGGLPDDPVRDAASEDQQNDWPAQIGRYEVSSQIAAGGMGVILEARDPVIGRRLAIKVTRKGGSPELESRFLGECQITGQLQHPGVPPIHEVGRLPDGRPFLSMKLIKGRTLEKLLREREDLKGDLHQQIDLFEQICQTLAYAHDRGIIHRDLKPSNIMVGAFGEVQVMDWGLAKLVDDQSADAGSIAEQTHIRTVRSDSPEMASQAGSVLGTPAFMAPEQARGELELVDRRADVFGLGGILCVVLTGTAPFESRIAQDALQRARHGDVSEMLQRLDQCEQPAELVDLAKQCIAPLAYQRPMDAQAVALKVSHYKNRVEERLRKAEVERGAAVVRLAEERKRRRLNMLLAVLALLTATTVTWFGVDRAYRVKEQANRVSRIEEDISAALDEAERLHDSALGMVETPDRWGATLARASAQIDRCKTLFEDTPTLVAPQLHERYENVSQRIASNEEDMRFVVGFEEIIQSQASNRPNLDFFVVADTYPVLLKLLADYGIASREIDLNNLHDLVAAKPDLVQPHIMAAIYEGYFLADINKDGESAKWFLDAYDAVPKTQWQVDTLSAAKERDLSKLRSLIDDKRVSREPSSLLRRIARELRDFGAEFELALLRRAQRERVRDFWINQSLGHTLLMQATRGSEVFNRKQLTPKQRDLLEESARCLMLAVAARPSSAGAHQNLGLALTAKREFAAAEVALRAALKLAPGSASHYYNLAEMFAEKRETAVALAFLDEGLPIVPSPARLHHLRALILHDIGQLADAERAYRMAEQTSTDSRKALYYSANLAQLLLELGKLSEATTRLQQAVKDFPEHKHFHNALGVAFRAGNHFEEAIAAFKQQIKVDPSTYNARLNLAEMLQDIGKHVEAVELFQEAIRLSKPAFEAHVGLARSRIAQGDAMAAARRLEFAATNADDYKTCVQISGLFGDGKCFESSSQMSRKLIRLDPSRAPGYVNLAGGQVLSGESAKTVDLLKQMMDWKPDLKSVHLNYSEALLRVGKLEEALEVYRHCRDKFKFKSGGALEGRIQLLLGRFPDALETLKSVAASDSEFARVPLYRMLCHIFLGNVNDAKTVARQAADPSLLPLLQSVLEKPKKDQLSYLGVVLMQRNEWRLAILAFEQGRKISPENASHKANMGVVLMMSDGRYAEALPLLEDVKRNEGMTDRIASIRQSNLGACLIGLKRYDEALQHLQTAIELDKSQVQAHFHLGRVYRAMGRHSDGIAALANCLRLAPGYRGAHMKLAELQMEALQFREAAKTWNEVLGRMSPRDPLKLRTALNLLEARKNIALDAQRRLLPYSRPADPRQQLELASLIARYPHQRLHAASLYLSAFKSIPPRVAFEGDRYQAAKAAIQALDENDGSALNEAQRRSLRRQALTWLREELTAIQKLDSKQVPPLRHLLRRELGAWYRDTVLARTRDGAVTNRLSPEEQRDWAALWEGVQEFANAK